MTSVDSVHQMIVKEKKKKERVPKQKRPQLVKEPEKRTNKRRKRKISST